MITTQDNTLLELNSPVRTIKGKVELYCSSTKAKSGKVVLIQEPEAKAIKATTTAGATVYRYGKNILDYTKATDRQGNALTIIEDGVLWDKTINYYFYIPCFIPAGVGFDVSYYADYAENPDTISSQFQVLFEDGTTKAITNGAGYWHTAKKNITKIGFRKTNTSRTETTPIKVTNMQVEIVDIPEQERVLVVENVENFIYRGFEPTEYELYIEPEVIQANSKGIAEGFTHIPYMSFITASGDDLTIDYKCGNAFKTAYTANDVLQSLTIDRVGESGKFFGFGICQKLNFKIIDKDRSVASSTDDMYKVFFAAGAEDYITNFPAFYTTEAHRDENTNALSITAYDVLKKAEEITVAELDLPQSYNLTQFATIAAAKIGLSLSFKGVGAFFSEGVVWETGANFEGTESLKTAFNAIAEFSQTIYYVSGEQLVFRKLDDAAAPDAEITKAQYITLESGENRRLSAITATNELGNALTASIAASGTTQYIRDNAFLEMRNDVDTILENAIAAIGGLTINQFNCKWRGNYLTEIGDKIALTTKDNNNVISYILNDVIEYNGAYSQHTQWKYTENKAEGANNPSTLGEAIKHTFATVDKVNKEIKIVASESNANKDAISNILVNTNTITASVENMQTKQDSVNDDIEELTKKVNATLSAEAVQIQIQEELAKGTNKVSTTTGFTFDETGLTVSKDGSEMTTTITEDGMKVYRDNTEVLTANNTGVDATNLRATTYLIVGSNSRFEDYVGRTGCFWIGG